MRLSIEMQHDASLLIGLQRPATQTIAATADVVILKFHPSRRDGGTGRRNGLKIRRPSGHGGSTPPPGTTQSKFHLHPQNGCTELERCIVIRRRDCLGGYSEGSSLKQRIWMTNFNGFSVP